MTKWTQAPIERAKDCESRFQLGGPRVYYTRGNDPQQPLRAARHSAQRMVDTELDSGDAVYSRRKAGRRYEWFVAVVPFPEAHGPAPGTRIFGVNTSADSKLLVWAATAGKSPGLVRLDSFRVLSRHLTREDADQAANRARDAYEFAQAVLQLPANVRPAALTVQAQRIMEGL